MYNRIHTSPSVMPSRHATLCSAMHAHQWWATTTTCNVLTHSPSPPLPLVPSYSVTLLPSLSHPLTFYSSPPLPLSPPLPSPWQVEAHLLRLWRNDGAICHALFNRHSLTLLPPQLSPPPAPLKALLPSSPLEARGRGSVGPQSFFLRCLLVTPNKFRPPNKLGDNVRALAR